ncbi:MAG: hypothetical protein E7588_07325 [Ruminococcaceae bacterium]|nr:hypothetical protein [Oscillospiraceae bacterium]
MTKFQKWLDNYWYHYKWPTIIGSLFALFIIICTVQMFSKKAPDAHIMYAGPASVSFTSLDEIEQSFNDIISADLNGDKRKIIEYVEITLNDRVKITEEGELFSEYINNNLDYKGSMLERYNAEIAFGDSVIYLLSPGIYQDLKSNGQLVPLVAERLLYDIPDNAFDEYSFKLSDMDIYRLPGLCMLPEDTLVCVRNPDKRLQVAKISDQAFKNNVQVFREMVNYVHPQETE